MVRNGKATQITKLLSKSKQGREILCALVAYYCNHMGPDYSKYELDLNIDIERYRYEPDS